MRVFLVSVEIFFLLIIPWKNLSTTKCSGKFFHSFGTLNRPSSLMSFRVDLRGRKDYGEISASRRVERVRFAGNNFLTYLLPHLLYANELDNSPGRCFCSFSFLYLVQDSPTKQRNLILQWDPGKKTRKAISPVKIPFQLVEHHHFPHCVAYSSFAVTLNRETLCYEGQRVCSAVWWVSGLAMPGPDNGI